MIFRTTIIFLALFLTGNLVQAQVLSGRILDSEGQAAATARINWLGTNAGAIADKKGEFELSTLNISDRRLIVNYTGHYPDTISAKTNDFLEISLSAYTLDDVRITEKQDGSYISDDPVKTEVITETELEKGACCDLAGCFNNQTTVRPITTNIVTNSKELRILGLSGVYNQVLVDGFPMMIQGQTYTYGISTIPGTLVEKIYVAKGANSVLQGFESISGQINVITKSPSKADRFFFNAYTNSFLESQYNAHFAHRWNKWSTIVAAHTTQPARTVDRDDDNFLDVAKIKRYSVYNKWEYSDEDSLGFSTRFSGRFVRENRIGGQLGYRPERDAGTQNHYGQSIDFSQPEVYARFGYRFDNKHNVALFASGFQQQQNSWFGVTRYDAQQINAYANLQYEMRWAERHMLKTGFSFRHVDRVERITFAEPSLSRTYDGSYLRKEEIPGIFAENRFNWLDDQLTLITGVRLDHHNDFGWIFTPRALVRYDFDESTSARLSAGTGWRTANIFTENVNLLASSRDVVFVEDLEPERALNLGFNITNRQKWDDFELQVSLDAYRIQFQNQIFPDYDSDPSKAFISNFDGPSISNGLQGEVKLEMFERAEIKAGYNYLQVYRQINGEKFILPFNPLHRFHVAAGYSPLSQSWQADLNLHWYGAQRLTNTSTNPVEFQVPESSTPYTIVNAQLSKNWKKFEIYSGCENIFDFRQLRPLIGWQDPFGTYFDSSNAWGPTRGREFYLGIRIKLE